MLRALLDGEVALRPERCTVRPTSAGRIRVKNVKALFVLFGAIGVVSLFLPMMEGFPSLFSVDKGQFGIMAAAFGVPAIVGAMSLAKPPAEAWHAIAGLAGFALAAFKVKIWESLPHIMDMPMSMKLMIVAAVGGLVVAIIGVVKPEAKA